MVTTRMRLLAESATYKLPSSGSYVTPLGTLNVARDPIPLVFGVEMPLRPASVVILNVSDAALDGREDGWEDGCLVGCRVGCLLGWEVGIRDGWADGWEDG